MTLFTSDKLPPDRHVRRSGDDYASAFLQLLPQGQAWPKQPGSTLERACTGLSLYWGNVDAAAADFLEIEADPRKTRDPAETPDEPIPEEGLLPDWERAFGLPDPCLTPPATYDARRAALIERITTLGAQSRQYFLDWAERLGYTQITYIREWSPWMVGIGRCGDNRPASAWMTTSATSLAVVTGSKVFTVASGLPYTAGQEVVITSQAAPEDRFLGKVTSYSGTALTVDVDRIGDAGTHADWLIMRAEDWHPHEIGPPEMRFYWSVSLGPTNLIWFRCGPHDDLVDINGEPVSTQAEIGVDPHLIIDRALDLECIYNRYKPAHTIVLFDYSDGPIDPMAGTP